MRSYYAYFILLAILIATAVDLWMKDQSLFMIGIAITSLIGFIIMKYLTEHNKEKK